MIIVTVAHSCLITFHLQTFLFCFTPNVWREGDAIAMTFDMRLRIIFRLSDCAEARTGVFKIFCETPHNISISDSNTCSSSFSAQLKYFFSEKTFLEILSDVFYSFCVSCRDFYLGFFCLLGDFFHDEWEWKTTTKTIAEHCGAVLATKICHTTNRKGKVRHVCVDCCHGLKKSRPRPIVPWRDSCFNRWREIMFPKT